MIQIIITVFAGGKEKKLRESSSKRVQAMLKNKGGQLYSYVNTRFNN